MAIKTVLTKPIVAVGEFTDNRNTNKKNLGKFSKGGQFDAKNRGAASSSTKPVGIGQVQSNPLRPSSVTLTEKKVSAPVVTAAPSASASQQTPVTTPKKVTTSPFKSAQPLANNPIKNAVAKPAAVSVPVGVKAPLKSNTPLYNNPIKALATKSVPKPVTTPFKPVAKPAAPKVAASLSKLTLGGNKAAAVKKLTPSKKTGSR